MTRISETADPQGRQITADVGLLVADLLLFEEVIVQSIRLQELPALVAMFGVDGTELLFQSNAISLYANACSVGQLGQLAASESRMEKGLLPLLGYNFSVIRVPDWGQYVDDCLRRVSWATIGASTNDVHRIENALRGALVTPVEAEGQEAVTSLEQRLRSNEPVVKLAVARAIGNRYGIQIQPNEFSFVLEEIQPRDFVAKTDVLSKFALTRQEAHDLVSTALLSVSGVEFRLEMMKDYTTMHGFQEDDLSLLDARLDFLVEQLSPDPLRAEFRRISEIGDVPRPDPGVLVDVKRLLDIRQSDEIREFREWLRATPEVGDEEVNELVNGVKARVAGAYQSTSGKTLRFMVGAGMGTIPIVGGLLSMGFDLLDTFVLDKVLRRSGAVTFVNRLYPSVFE